MFNDDPEGGFPAARALVVVARLRDPSGRIRGRIRNAAALPGRELVPWLNIQQEAAPP